MNQRPNNADGFPACRQAGGGWHIPTDAEWITLTTFLGGDSIAGNRMKEAGTSHWMPLDLGADNSSGFTALPGGWRHYDGSFNSLGFMSWWWSDTESDSGSAWTRGLDYGYTGVYRETHGKTLGCSVRCIRD